MTDLHCHILPGIDDGAQNVEESIALIRRQREQGVRQIALTSHFNAERTTVEEFVEERAKSYEILQDALQKEGLDVTLKLGAEVFFSSDLLELDLQPLLLEGTDYLLVEFSPTFYPTWAKDIFYQMGLDGITPLLAHVERYPYMLSDPTRLYDLVNAGAVTQVNATSLLRSTSRQAMVRKFLKWNLVHVLASDTHSMDKRPPLLAKAFGQVQEWEGDKMVQQLRQNAEDVFRGRELRTYEPTKPKKLLSWWL